MKIFLTAECEALGGSLLGSIQKIVSKGMRDLKEKEYGEELTEISIITVLLQEKYFEDGDFSESSFFSRKHRYAVIRKRLNLRRFLLSSPTMRYQMYCDHIIAAIKTLQRKVSRQYQFEELLLDIQSVLFDPEIQKQCESLRRLP